MIERRPFDDLSGEDIGWLKAKHHFSFGQSADAAPNGLGLRLRIWNDDEFAPNTGFSAPRPCQHGNHHLRS